MENRKGENPKLIQKSREGVRLAQEKIGRIKAIDLYYCSCKEAQVKKGDLWKNRDTQGKRS